MDPDKFFQPSAQAAPPPQPVQPGQVPGAPYGGPPQPAPQFPQQSPAPPAPKKPKTLVIVSIVLGVLLVLAIIVALIMNSGDKTANQAQPTPAQDSTTQAEILEPAQSVEVEQTSNSLSQDLSGLDDEKDLPTNSLDDKTLGL
jgi:hypothetical protein